MYRICFAALLSTLAAPALATEYVGTAAHIRDGDTFVLRSDGVDRPIRLCGVDSPEQGQKGYWPAREALEALLAGQTVRCVQVGSGTPCDGRSRGRSRDRIVAQCFVGEKDVGTEMVRAGHACAWLKFSGNHYRLSADTCTR